MGAANHRRFDLLNATTNSKKQLDTSAYDVENSRMSKRTHYSDKEIALLREFYPKGGPILCMKHMPNRTYEGISYKAQSMGLVSPFIRQGRKEGSGAWTEQELSLLRRSYPRVGVVGCADLFPTKSRTAIQSQANRLGIRFTFRKPKVEKVIGCDEVDSWPVVQKWAHVGEWKAETVNGQRFIFEAQT